MNIPFLELHHFPQQYGMVLYTNDKLKSITKRIDNILDFTRQTRTLQENTTDRNRPEKQVPPGSVQPIPSGAPLVPILSVI